MWFTTLTYVCTIKSKITILFLEAILTKKCVVKHSLHIPSNNEIFDIKTRKNCFVNLCGRRQGFAKNLTPPHYSKIFADSSINGSWISLKISLLICLEGFLNLSKMDRCRKVNVFDDSTILAYTFRILFRSIYMLRMRALTSVLGIVSH